MTGRASGGRQSLADLIAQRAQDDATYLEDARGDATLSYAQLARAVDAWRDVLDSAGVPAGGGVLVDLADPLSFAVVHLAAIAAGRRSIPVDSGAPSGEVARLAGLIGAAHLVVSDRDDVTPAAEGVPRAGIRTSDRLPDALGDERVAAEPEPADEGSVVLFTSGSTGTPKGVELGERQLMTVARAVARHNALTSADRGYNPLPLFHVNAEVVGLLATLVAGATLVADRRFRRTGFWELMAERRITWINAVPAILAVLARSGAIDAPEGVRFIRSASAPLPDVVKEAFAGIPLVVSWGMTEAASQITATPLGDTRLGTVGPPVIGEVQVRDDDGALAAPGVVGALFIRGEGVIRRYLRDAAEDRFDAEGWLATGDVGSVDDDGWVTLVGRSDDVINRGGEKVHPSEVEEVLLGDERVREAVVVAKPDEVLGQVPVAYIVPVAADGAETDAAGLAEALAERARRHLPRFKRPVSFEIVPDVPRAPTGKVQRARVREAAAHGATDA